MRRAAIETKSGSRTEFSVQALARLASRGYKYVQVKGLTLDRHYDYMEPQLLVLVPVKELPNDPMQKDIYEPLPSKLLNSWAVDKGGDLKIVIAKN